VLPDVDTDYLRETAPAHAVSVEAGVTCVVIPKFSLGNGFHQAESDLLLRLRPGYPDVAPDMWWFSPPVRRLDNAEIPATQAREHHLGREWQRWSRHLPAGVWRPGIDGLESYIAIVRRELAAAAPKVAA
jgi:hypothetical protein